MSRYSQMTSESNSAMPSSVIKVGILLSGLSRISARFGSTIAVGERCRLQAPSSCFSIRQIPTLRTKGEIGPPCSFIAPVLKETRRGGGGGGGGGRVGGPARRGARKGGGKS